MGSRAYASNTAELHPGLARSLRLQRIALGRLSIKSGPGPGAAHGLPWDDYERGKGRVVEPMLERHCVDTLLKEDLTESGSFLGAFAVTGLKSQHMDYVHQIESMAHGLNPTCYPLGIAVV
eukprot:3015369-Rhodomonas_salina.1